MFVYILPLKYLPTLIYTCKQAGTQTQTHTHTSIYIKLSLSQVVNGVEGLQIHRVSKKILNK